MSTVHCSRLSLDVDASLRRHRRRAPPQPLGVRMYTNLAFFIYFLLQLALVDC